ncbi:MAG TPA: hypothetical protein DC026_01295 [Erythrobacter sp.]|jgi:hypothetical protein|nr:hypothetical protein [Erythrobacter sp.]
MLVGKDVLPVDDLEFPPTLTYDLLDLIHQIAVVGILKVFLGPLHFHELNAPAGEEPDRIGSIGPTLSFNDHIHPERVTLKIEDLCVDLVPHCEPWLTVAFKDLCQARFSRAKTAAGMRPSSRDHWTAITALLKDLDFGGRWNSLAFGIDATPIER